MHKCKKGLPKELRETLKLAAKLKNKNFKQSCYKYFCFATSNLETHLLFSKIYEKLHK